MNLFCSFAYTGEDIKIVTDRMRRVVDLLDASGYQAYCNLFDSAIKDTLAKGDIKGIFADAFDKLSQCDAIVVIISSPSRSIGQIMEIGVGFHEGKKIYIFEHESAIGTSYLHEFGDKHYTWKTDDDLLRVLATACKDFDRIN